MWVKLKYKLYEIVVNGFNYYYIGRWFRKKNEF